MKKQAYLINAHDKFDQLIFLLSRLDFEGHDFFIHIDKKSTITQETLDAIQQATQFSTVYLVPRISVHWGHSSQIDSEFLLFSTARKTRDYSMYHLISGVDLPLQNAETIYQFFENKTDKIFITRFNQDEFRDLQLYKLVEHYHFTSKISARDLHTIPRKLLRAYRILENKVQTLLHVDRLGGNRENWGLDAYANWKSIGQDVVDAMLAEEDFIRKHFRFTYCADELYFPLILKRANLLDRIYHAEPVTDSPDELQGNLRYINWWDGHPYEWTDSEKDLAQLDKGRALGHLFSRKFNLEKYPAIKEYILEKTSPED